MRIRVRREPALGVAVLCTAAVVLSGCTTPAVDVGGPPPASPTSGAPAPSAAPKPNAPEVNPAGDIPDNQVFVAYSPPGVGFVVSVPEGWARTTDGAATTFTDKFNAIRMESFPTPTAPASPPGAVSQVTRKAGLADLTKYDARSAADPVTGKTVATTVERYEFRRSGRSAVLTLTAPQGADNVDPWRIVTNSFAWTS